MLERSLDQNRALVAERVREVGRPRTYPARSFIFHEGDDPTTMFVVESGLARIEHTSRTGRVVLFDLAMAGRVVGELGVINQRPRSATVSTISDTAVHHIGSDEFRRMLATDSELQGAMLALVAQRTREMSLQLVETSTMEAPGRVATRLIRLIEIEQSFGRSPFNHDGSIELKLLISQEELGQWSGLSREGTVKGLTALRKLNLIETGRKRVRINDLDKLSALAELD